MRNKLSLAAGGEEAGVRGWYARPVRSQMRISLRNKLLIFAILIAVVPLIVAGRSMIRIAQDELKSSANERAGGRRRAAGVGDQRPVRADMAGAAAADPQRAGRRAAGRPEKIALLTLGIEDIPEIVALQITVEGAPVPVVVVKSDFSKRLARGARSAGGAAACRPSRSRRLRERRRILCRRSAPRPGRPTTGSRPSSCRCSRCSARRDLAVGAHRPRPSCAA